MAKKEIRHSGETAEGKRDLPGELKTGKQGVLLNKEENRKAKRRTGRLRTSCTKKGRLHRKQ